MAKILYFTDMDSSGSGYLRFSETICNGLVTNYGHDVKVLGLGYRGQQHKNSFSIIPTIDMMDAHAMIINMHRLWNFDILIVALDIPHHIFFIDKLKNEGIKYIAITPLENPPLRMSWSAGLLPANAVFFISEIASNSAKKAGLVNSDYLQIGLDFTEWKFASDKDKINLKSSLGFSDKFVVLSVSENQERKNPWALLDIIAKAKEQIPNIQFVWVTTEYTQFGINVRDLTTELGINDNVLIIEKGISLKELWSLYAAADVFLLASKAEGLGLPILESFSVGLPVVATNTGAITELLSDGRGFLVSPEYSIIDVWGNSKRDFINRQEAADILGKINSGILDKDSAKKLANDFIMSRDIFYPSLQLDKKIKEILNEKVIS